MFMPGYAEESKPANDLDMLRTQAAKIKRQTAQFSKEGRDQRKQFTQQRKTTAERRRIGDQMKKDGADPKAIRHYLLTGER